MEDWTQTLGAGPLLGIAAGAIALILVLVIVFKLHAFLTLVIVSAVTAIATGIPTGEIADTLISSFGSTLGSVALLVGLGAMLGRLVESSGGARVLADRMVDVFGEKRAPFALGLASLIMGFPIFFDAGLIVMLPIVFAVARRMGGRSMLLYGISAAGAFSVMHVFLPPHPGPVSATDLLGANIGVVLLAGLIVAFPLWYVSGYLWAKVANARNPLPVLSLFGDEKDDVQAQNPPKAGTVIAILCVPLVLILMNTLFTTLGTFGAVDPENPVIQGVVFLGTSSIALLISVFVAMFVLGRARGVQGSALEKTLESALGPICSVVLITGAGGMFGGVLRTSGIGDALSTTLGDIGLPVIIAAWLIAAILRLAQGSATVALVTAAGLVAPAVAAANLNSVELAAVVLATAAGSVFAGHVNDSGFWLVGRLMGMDVKTTLKTWTVQQAIESVLGLGAALVVFAVGALL